MLLLQDRIPHMATFEDLPVELVDEVLSYLELHRPELQAMASTSRGFNHRTRKFLFRHADNLSGNQHPLFWAALEISRELSSLVHTYGPVAIDPRGLISLVNYKVLPVLTALKRLQVRLGSSNDLRSCTHDIFASGLLERVESIHFIGSEAMTEGLPTSLLQGFMSQPKLRTLTVSQIRNSNNTDTTHDTLLTQSKVTTLEFFGRANTVLSYPRPEQGLRFREHFSSNCLQYYLALCPNLKTLRCVDLKPNFGTNHRGGRTHNPCHSAFSRRYMERVLNTVADTLEELTYLITNDISVWAYGKPINFSRLVRLRSLKIAAILLRPKDHSFVAIGDICKLLPPNLEKLQLTFSNVYGVFHNANCDPLLRKDDHVPAERYAWIFHLANGKRTTLHGLKTITLIDAAPLSDHIMERWIPPRDVVEMYEEVDIHLNVLLCIHLAQEPIWKKPVIA
ncbi:hypothetical protein B0J11DRAFT_277861 [Dendryphion nanum]|uniref:F-box domain-containing protein n=1 Tax=Dendryphion nanum TaxID=256645 RepID=A0A9P9E0Y4_9PLEO|nr:hypothetical protein B0J11DRAFT_277861 [Dendryphion nanum]